MESIVDALLNSGEPAIRYGACVRLLGADPVSASAKRLRSTIRTSPRVTALLSERQADGCIPYGAYSKWYGAHWVLATLADLDYPPGDKTLIPLREQVLDWLLSTQHEASIHTLNGRVRRCASQEGNALFALLRLGLSDARCDELAARLMRWQWPDGGWNCDKNPEAMHSSFMESLIPLRALALYARRTGDAAARASAERAANIFLKRHLFKRQRDGTLMRADFVKLHYPCYWHYDILFSLKVMAEAGFIGDPRCNDALDLLESKHLPDGGFPAEARFFHLTAGEKRSSGLSLVDWGVRHKKQANEFVTLDALYVLRAAGRWTPDV